jgi:hypothetical protein
MAVIIENFDVKIRVVFPFLTKSLPKNDSSRINATGNFNFSPPPQVDTAQGLVLEESPVKGQNYTERVDNLKSGLDQLMIDFDKIQDIMRKRSQHLILTYDPELTENEALANAEIDLFGSASGRITYQMFEQVLAYQEKINKYISHLSVENGGTVERVA